MANEFRCDLCNDTQTDPDGQPCMGCTGSDAPIDNRERETAHKKEDSMDTEKTYSENAIDFNQRVIGSLEVCHSLDDVTYRSPDDSRYFHRETFHRPFHLAMQVNGLDWVTQIHVALDNGVAVRFYRYSDKSVFILNPDKTITKVVRVLSDDYFVLLEKQETVVGTWSMRKPFKNGGAGGVKSDRFSKILTLEIEGEDKLVAPVYECNLGGVKTAMYEVAKRIQKRLRLSSEWIRKNGIRKPYSNKHEGLLMDRKAMRGGLGTTKFKASSTKN